MPIIYVGPGHKVFVIMRNHIYEGKIMKVLANNRMEVSYRVFRERIDVGNFEYGRNVFMTRAKAEKILNEILSKEIHRDKSKDVNEGDSKEYSIGVCQSCQTPINSFGHCRCSL